MFGITPRASQIAQLKPDEQAIHTRVITLALNGFKDLGHGKIRISDARVCG